MPDPVPAPEQPGEPRTVGSLFGLPIRIDTSVPPGEMRVESPEEQQGEPVCARCGHPESERFGGCSRIHAGPPAPPSSEEAEAHRVSTRGENSRGLWAGSTWRFHNAMGEPIELFIPAPVEAAIRSPLEERVRELTDALDQELRMHEMGKALMERDAARIQALEEERDRLQSQLDGWMNATGVHVRRAEAAEAQVAKLREALLDQWEWNHAEHCGKDLPHDRCHWPQPAILTETVQEGGETQ